MRLRWGLLLLLRWCSSLEWLLLRSWWLLELALLPWKASVLLLHWLLLLLLPESLRLSRKACVLLLQWSPSKTCRLRCQSALKASRLLPVLLLLLLAILRLPRSGAVAAP